MEWPIFENVKVFWEFRRSARPVLHCIRRFIPIHSPEANQIQLIKFMQSAASESIWNGLFNLDQLSNFSCPA